MRLGPSVGVYVAVAVGGVAGGLLRALVLALWSGQSGEFSLALLTINSGGSFLIGLVLAFSESARRHRLPPAIALGLMAGFCGALTTFSTFALESLALVDEPAIAAGYVAVSLACWLAAGAAGLFAGRRMNAPVGT
ncbi:fluoride efflux transporter FluC [Wenzhouxiangella sp. EGI_FJ10305]|uniref:fluoride efflux transporter FluC n=1 Tax=Wenzhouxiangella sp. EGI_FJ10305 TaxID=3243768 RepID=UPI0035DDC66F